MKYHFLYKIAITTPARDRDFYEKKFMYFWNSVF